MCQQYLVSTERMSALTASLLFGFLKSGMFSMLCPNGPLTLPAISLKAAEMPCKEDVLPVCAEMNLPNLPP